MLEQRKCCGELCKIFDCSLDDIVEYKTDSKAREFTLTFVQKEGFDNIENEIYIPKKGIYRFKAKPGKYTVKLKY